MIRTIKLLGDIMNRVDKAITEGECILETKNSPFFQQSSEKLQSLTPELKTLLLKGKHYDLEHDSIEVTAIFKAIVAGMQSDWYLHHTLKNQYETSVANFVVWLKAYDIKTKDKYQLLNLFEAHRVNSDKVKPQSSGMPKISALITEALECNLLPTESQKYIDQLLEATKISKAEDSEATDLGAWFFSMHWLREFVSEKDYLQLSSPKTLMNSFSITVATTLLEIISAKKKLKNHPKIHSLGSIEGNLSSKAANARSFARDLVENVVLLDDELKPADTLSALIIQDCVHPKLVGYVLDRLATTTKRSLNSESTRYKIPKDTKINGKRISCFLTPRVFNQENITSLSTLEQWLFSFICAWQAIQPSDILKLKVDNFSIVRNSNGRPTHIQCTYYKSRAKIEHSTPVLAATSIEAKAILAYLSEAGISESDILTPDLKITQQIFAQSDGSDCFVLSRIWSDKTLSQGIRKQLKINNSSDVFRKAIVAAHQFGDTPYSAWASSQVKKHNAKTDREEYLLAMNHPVPHGWIGLQMIKTSSVYSRTDQYRSNDLANQNSHSAKTEKLSYLTENNIEWVNQHGRISRLVMAYIAKIAYAPSIERSLMIAEEMKVRSRVLAITGELGDLPMSSTAEAFISDTLDSYEPDEIYVWDAAETVLIMRHYISEAVRQVEPLLAHSPLFFENTVLPKVEWMTFVINSLLSPAIVREGDSAYAELSDDLPPLFESEIRSQAT